MRSLPESFAKLRWLPSANAEPPSEADGAWRLKVYKAAIAETHAVLLEKVKLELELDHLPGVADNLKAELYVKELEGDGTNNTFLVLEPNEAGGVRCAPGSVTMIEGSLVQLVSNRKLFAVEVRVTTPDDRVATARTPLFEPPAF